MPNDSYPLRVGLFSIGLEAYWPQFEGLRDRLTAFNRRIAEKIEGCDVSVENLGLIDTPQKAVAAGHRFREADVDLIFLHVSTYALSSTVLPVVRRAKVPVIILNLAPGAAIDYSAFNQMSDRGRMTGEWLAWCQACPVPEIANVFRRCRIPFFQVTGMLDDDAPAWDEIAGWVQAARAAHVMEHNRLGLMGHYYGGMLDIYSDLTRHCAAFGGHMEMLEVDELARLRQGVCEPEIDARVDLFHSAFDVQPGCPAGELRRAARTSVALDRLVAEHGLGSLAYYYQGIGIPENEDAISSIILGTSLLTARGIPVAGEYEVKNVQAMKIMDAFGAGGSFTEYYATDFREDIVLMGHDGPGHMAIAARQDEGPAAGRLSRQGGKRPVGGDVGQAWAGDASFRRGDRSGRHQAADGRRRVGARADSGDRQHQQPLPLPLGRAKVHGELERGRAGAPLCRGRRARCRQDRETG